MFSSFLRGKIWCSDSRKSSFCQEKLQDQNDLEFFGIKGCWTVTQTAKTADIQCKSEVSLHGRGWIFDLRPTVPDNTWRTEPGSNKYFEIMFRFGWDMARFNENLVWKYMKSYSVSCLHSASVHVSVLKQPYCTVYIKQRLWAVMYWSCTERHSCVTALNRL